MSGTVEELLREFLRQLNGLALIAERNVRPRGPKEYWRRKLSQYFMHVNYSTMLERIRRAEYPSEFIQEKLQQIEELKAHPELLSVATIVGARAKSVYSVRSFNSVINENRSSK